MAYLLKTEELAEGKGNRAVGDPEVQLRRRQQEKKTLLRKRDHPQVPKQKKARIERRLAEVCREEAELVVKIGSREVGEETQAVSMRGGGGWYYE